MEEERVQAQADAARRTREARARVEQEAQNAARMQYEAREHAAEQRRIEDGRRTLEEAARLERLRLAAIESARTEAEAKARTLERERDRLHELQMVQARDRERAGALKRSAIAACLGLTAIGAVATALCFAVVAPRERERTAQASIEVASQADAIRNLGARLDASETRARALEADLASARDERERLRQELDRLKRQVPHAHSVVPGASSGVGHERSLDYFSKCPPGSKDPMCLQ